MWYKSVPCYSKTVVLVRQSASGHAKSLCNFHVVHDWAPARLSPKKLQVEVIGAVPFAISRSVHTTGISLKRPDCSRSRRSWSVVATDFPFQPKIGEGSYLTSILSLSCPHSTLCLSLALSIIRIRNVTDLPGASKYLYLPPDFLGTSVIRYELSQEAFVRPPRSSYLHDNCHRKSQPPARPRNYTGQLRPAATAAAVPHRHQVSLIVQEGFCSGHVDITITITATTTAATGCSFNYFPLPPSPLCSLHLSSRVYPPVHHTYLTVPCDLLRALPCAPGFDSQVPPALLTSTSRAACRAMRSVLA
ncbi:hypothetical protein GGR56DRAFT_272508 [Xylariaceae sp. FL0804]|nr:hypothetical protein GGR56DRAFT_272508 [Xylariaceae sp. FL0804]